MSAIDLVYGINPVIEGLRGTLRAPIELFLLKGPLPPRLNEALQLANSKGIAVRLRDRQDLDRLAGHKHHQGAILHVSPFAYCDLDDLVGYWRNSGRPAFFLVLDGITDPHNYGAILRSADAAGCHGVIVGKDRACPVSAVVEKSASGALAHLPLAQVTNISRALEELKKEGIWVYGLAGDTGSEPLYHGDYRGHVAFVAGSEGEGLRPNVRRHCDYLVAIPMLGQVSSLNVSVATALALFEVVRQRPL